VSRAGIGRPLSESIQHMSDLVVRAAAQPPGVTQLAPTFTFPGDAHDNQHSGRAATQIPEHLSNALLNALCCVMVADGRASRSEKAQIRQMMAEAGVLWDEHETDMRVASFIERIGRDGYRRILAAMLDEIPRFKADGASELLINCVERLIQSDGQATDRELQLCARMRALVQ